MVEFYGKMKTNSRCFSKLAVSCFSSQATIGAPSIAFALAEATSAVTASAAFGEAD